MNRNKRLFNQSYLNSAVATITLVTLAVATGARAASGSAADLARTVMQYACTEPFQSSLLAKAVNAQSTAPAETISARGRQFGQRTRLVTASHQITIERLQRDQRLGGVRIIIHDPADQPLLFVAADKNCRPRMARRVDYDQDNRAQHLQTLDADLAPRGDAEPLNPPVPAASDPGGVRVALVDAGVNYLLPHIGPRLARDDSGGIIGFDYWDMDKRPFDSHPVPSLFLTQRHGTRTASLLLREAPGIALVPYRYPRPDMRRMQQLVEHAHDAGVRVVGLPLGGKREDEWLVFAQSARAHPEMLFIASAGNFGRDIDDTPMFPASLDLPNLLVVSSANDFIVPAEGTNWGAKSVDLLVAAERQDTIDFNGNARTVSGSSYAVSRILALAARIAEQNPDWRGPEIKRAILARTLSMPHLQPSVSVGYLPDPLAQPGDVVKTQQHTLNLAERDADLLLQLDLVWLQGSGWTQPVIERIVQRADQIVGQCGIKLAPVTLHELRVRSRLLDFDVHTAHTLITQQKIPKPTVYLTRDSRRETGFEGEAFGKGNSRTRPWLANTVWLVADVHQPALALAHELFHVVNNSGIHSNVNDNLMNTRTRPTATHLSDAQCKDLRKNGRAQGLLLPSA